MHGLFGTHHDRRRATSCIAFCVCLSLVCSPNPLYSDGSGTVSQEEYKALPHAKPTDKPEEVIHNFYLAYMDSVAPSHDET